MREGLVSEGECLEVGERGWFWTWAREREKEREGRYKE